MRYATHFSVNGGHFYDRDFNRLEIFSADYDLSDLKQTETNLLRP